MNDRIRGKTPSPVPRPTEAEPVKDLKGTKEVADAPRDQFARAGAPAVNQLETRLQALQGKSANLNKISFTNAELGELARVFATLMIQNPNADRLKRARLFTKAILKRKRLRRVFAAVSDNDMEQMCDEIADVLDSSPVFGQLVDVVAEESGKATTG